MLFNQNSQAKSSLIKAVLLGCVPITLGFGVYPLLIPALVIGLAGGGLISPHFSVENLHKTALAPGYLVFISALSLFFACYRGFYMPYHSEILFMPWSYFWVLLTLSILTVLWAGLLNEDNELIGFIWTFCLGSLVFCITTVSFAIWLQKPPFYGSVIDIRYLPFGIHKFINTPGIANLLCLFPVIFMASFLLEPKQRPRWFLTLGISGFALSLIAAITLGQRSYFVLALFITPLVVAFFLLLQQSWWGFIAICTLLISYPLLRVLDQAMGANLLARPIDQSMTNDGRFQMFQYWFQHITANPFQRIEVGPAEWSHLQWFHNFFADIHRLSGFWALLTAVVLVSYIFIRLIKLIQVNRRMGFFLMAIAIPCFLIMNTSVVPEAERQPFLLLLAIGAISEVILARRKESAN